MTYFLGGKGTEELPIVLVERKEGMFDKVFNLSGSLYKLSGSNFKPEKTGWSAEVVSEYDEKVLAEEYIEKVLDELNKMNKLGEIKLYRYPERPSYVPLNNSDLIPKVIQWHKAGFTNSVNNFLSIYPELEKEFLDELANKEKTKEF